MFTITLVGLSFREAYFGYLAYNSMLNIYSLGTRTSSCCAGTSTFLRTRRSLVREEEAPLLATGDRDLLLFYPQSSRYLDQVLQILGLLDARVLESENV